MPRRKTKPSVEIIPGYTAKQSQFIRGEITVDELDGRFFRYFLKNAIAANDEYYIETAKNLLEHFKEEAKAKSLERARERSRCIFHGETIVWKQPKSTEYTERQKKIARDEIPFEEVHTNELVSLCKKARAAGDEQLADMIYDFILDRREAEQEKKLKHLYKKSSPYTDSGDDFEGRDYLTLWEEGVLRNDIDPEECSTEHLEHILDVVRKGNNETYIKVAERLVVYRHDPSIVYITQDTEEALAIIEKITGIPIRRRNTWFTD